MKMHANLFIRSAEQHPYVHLYPLTMSCLTGIRAARKPSLRLGDDTHGTCILQDEKTRGAAQLAHSTSELKPGKQYW